MVVLWVWVWKGGRSFFWCVYIYMCIYVCLLARLFYCFMGLGGRAQLSVVVCICARPVVFARAVLLFYGFGKEGVVVSCCVCLCVCVCACVF